MPCTTLLAGKNATFDGSTLMARNEDSGEGHFTAKKFVVVNPQDQPGLYRSVISKAEIELPDNPVRYTAMPNALPDEGIWGEAGINDYNVAMSETETLTSNPRVLGADPLVKSGIGEEDMLTIVLPYIKSAREGVKRLGSLIEEYGTYEMNGIGFQDMDEIWWFESVGGHHWIARKVPDNAYVVMPNQQGIDYFDFADAYTEQKEHMCAADLAEFICRNYLDVGMPKQEELCEVQDTNPVQRLRSCRKFDVRGALGSRSDSDHVYNTPRAWFMLRYLNPRTFQWDGEAADFTPESDDLPWCLVPERKLTIEDFKYVLSSYYQGTPYNPYAKDAERKGKYRVIGINRNNFLSVTQLRPYMPKALAGIQWIAEGSNAFNALVPFYTYVRTTPGYLADTTAKVTTENFYWANRIIGALADAHYAGTIPHVERYQLKVLSEGHRMLGEFDERYGERASELSDPADTFSFLEECNQKLSDMVQEQTQTLLDKVLFTASSEMKNGFSRSDG